MMQAEHCSKTCPWVKLTCNGFAGAVYVIVARLGDQVVQLWLRLRWRCLQRHQRVKWHLPAHAAQESMSAVSAWLSLYYSACLLAGKHAEACIETQQQLW